MTALLIGIAFGWALERAGLGDSRKLAGQFYFTDLTVFKVMFTAIVTAMLGVFWLARLGVVSLASISVPETYLLPQLLGGLIFGAGFVAAGLCPGTSCVSAATGRADGLAVVLGLFTGVLLCGAADLGGVAFYNATPRGPQTLPQFLHLPYGVVVFAVVAMALTLFTLAERFRPAS
jgi:uncharacterized membrane protein YedE/YeeE